MEEIKSFLKSRAIINLLIVAANVVIFLVLDLRGGTDNISYMLQHGASYTPWIIEEEEYYRLFTCMFLHFGLDHLFNNMLVLIFLGDTLEKLIGKVRYLLIYFLGGLSGNLLSFWMEIRSGDYAVSAGASGAIFAVVGALIYIVIRNRGRMEGLTGRGLFLMAALSIFQGFTTVGVDNAAHVAGLLGGFVLAVVLYRKPKVQQKITW